MIYNFGAAVLRSKGDTKRPLYCLIISGVINACLNLLFVIVFKLSVAGVAIATVIADGVSAVLIIYFLMNEEETIRLRLNKLKIKEKRIDKSYQNRCTGGIARSGVLCFKCLYTDCYKQFRL